MTLTEITKIINRNDPDELFELGWINAWNSKINAPYGGDETNEYLQILMHYATLPSYLRNLMKDVFNSLMIPHHNARLSYYYRNNDTLTLGDRGYRLCELNEYTLKNQYSIKFNKELLSAIKVEIGMIDELVIPEIHMIEYYPILSDLIKSGLSISDAYTSINIKNLIRIGAWEEFRELDIDDIRYLSNVNDYKAIRNNLAIIKSLKKSNNDLSIEDIVKVIIEVENEFGE